MIPDSSLEPVTVTCVPVVPDKPSQKIIPIQHSSTKGLTSQSLKRKGRPTFIAIPPLFNTAHETQDDLQYSPWSSPDLGSSHSLWEDQGPVSPGHPISPWSSSSNDQSPHSYPPHPSFI
ncbi:hypothetical protein PHYBLDRAFT_65730 [Phycomyces blakesleeanus NRRL 1555(-)]|uniref:Uncharacterized protein n=1 Tax=Phycomyces blakesleeanus (strain ATCC 8743b / DSM 1359 / FGSC 10004 / NBRC 33097 / NRRL 1555) TaxID=763407 RepID=A0A162U820_PHYB8|nr:hypothetical protein PHYBLDRAFT_65730 [Phycomyces blakesleeanus NRRL 1555(-)]OAD73133.1 hypothetical protein PHYBLDRAFT_65730 [Phycomyces blakesleeanus NRRL 1555(-)]|eukprot:XP_018291173.1 hypothetical protein PHYBLDRAFT_65730 [Phycomyces blakesleeanus NRRL 1555(-)]